MASQEKEQRTIEKHIKNLLPVLLHQIGDVAKDSTIRPRVSECVVGERGSFTDHILLALQTML